jgi:hypothetical protein
MSDGKVALELKNQWNDGTTHLLFEPIEFIEKIAALIPRPQFNLIIYNGVLAPNAKWRKEVVKYGRPVGPQFIAPNDGEHDDIAPEPEKPGDGPRYRPWVERRARRPNSSSCTTPAPREGVQGRCQSSPIDI